MPRDGVFPLFLFYFHFFITKKLITFAIQYLVKLEGDA